MGVVRTLPNQSFLNDMGHNVNYSMYLFIKKINQDGVEGIN